MRIRKKKWAEPELAVCDFFVKNPEEHAGKWNETFNNGLPLYLEIGCGKGGFAGQFAVKNQDKNIIAVDIKIDMLGVGRRNIVEIFKNEGKTDADITNLLLVNYNVEQIDKIITKDDKNKRRLTFPKKLEMYKNFLDENAEIRFKTDDDALFADSLEYFEQSGYEIIYKTYDLHNSDVTDNIETEHEKMFSAEGIKIKYLRAVVKHD